MGKIIYNKLVRDGIPKIIKASGDVPIIRILNESEIEPALVDKLAEETTEFVQAEGDERLAELADMQEVIDALTKVAGFTLAQRQRAQRTKAEERGGFGGRVFLESVV